MPETTAKEVRLPELHLPEISREDIVRSLSEIRLPDVDLPKVDRSTLERSAAEIQKIDIGKAVAGAAAAVGIGGRARRPRWPLAFGVIIALGVIAWAVLRNPAVRERAEEAARAARERIDEMRAEQETTTITPSDIAVPVAEEAWVDETVEIDVPIAGNDPSDSAGDGIPAFEESTSRS